MPGKRTTDQSTVTTRLPFGLEAAEVAKLCQLLRRGAEGDGARIRAAVEEMGRNYRRWIKQEQASPALPKQRKRLAAIARLSQQLLVHLNRLDCDDEAQFHLMRAYQTSSALPGDRLSSTALYLIAIDHQHVGRLAAAAVKAQGKITIKKGPTSRGSLYLLVEGLCRFYVQETGRPVTHSRSKDTDYQGAPASPAGRFVTTAVRAIDQSVTPTQIATAMRQVVWKGASESTTGSSTE